MKNLLTIAGSDSSGGAGIQADLKTFAAHGVYGMSVITAVTAQNTQGVLAVQDIDDDIIAKQIQAIYEDISVAALKIGMVSQVSTIKIIAASLKKYNTAPVVLDPVMISKSGFKLLQPNAQNALIAELLPLATIATPNIPEAEAIIGRSINDLSEMKKAAANIFAMGCKAVLVKGGHSMGDATDVLFDGKEYTCFPAPRLATKNTHGTGCTLSAAIAANLGRGMSLIEAVGGAKKYITLAIAHALPIGKGVGPTHHFYELYRRAGLSEDNN